MERNYDARSALYEHAFLEFSVGSFGDFCGWCFCVFGEFYSDYFGYISVFDLFSDFDYRLWICFVFWQSVFDPFLFLTLDFDSVWTLGFRPVSVFDARFWLCLDSRFRPFSVFDARFWLCLDSRFRPFSVFDPRLRISSDWLIAPPSPPILSIHGNGSDWRFVSVCKYAICFQ